MGDRVTVVENDCVVLFAATVKLVPTPKGLVKFGSVPYSNEAQPPVPLGLMVPFSTALVLVMEVAASVVTTNGSVLRLTMLATCKPMQEGEGENNIA